MTPSGRLLQKHRSLWEGESIALDPDRSDESLFDALYTTQAGRRGSREVPDRQFDVAVLTLPKGRRRQAMMIQLAAQLAPRVVVVGSKQEGIKTTRKLLAREGRVVAVEHGGHRQMIVTEPSKRDPVDLDAWEERFEHDGLTVVSLPGVFSRGRVDAGTKLLLEHLDCRGAVLDVGCGSGILGAHLARAGCTVTLSDVDSLAVEAARRTLAINDLEGTCVHADGYAGIEGRFDAIVSNPPFHEGVATQYDTTLGLIRDAPKHLNEGGVLWLVYNRFLPWHDALTSTFSQVDELADDGRYRVVRAAMTS